MKKIILSLFVLFTALNIATAQQYDFKNGDSYTLTTSVDQVITQMMMGQEMEITNQVETVETYEVSAVENGVFTIKVTSISNKTTVDTPQGTQTMSSDGSAANDLAMKAITNISYSFKMDKTGKILEVMELEAAREHVNKTLTGTAMAPAIAQIQESYSEESLASNLDNKLNIYPEEKSDVWYKNKDLNLNNMPVTLKAEYSLSGNDVILDGDLAISGKGSFNGMQLDMNLEGFQNGTFTFDEDNGAILASESETTLSGSVGAQGMTIPMSISITTKTSMEKK